MAPFFVIDLGLLMGTWFTYLKSEVTLTDRRLVFRTGFLSRRSGELPLENVESIYISEPLLGRLCGYGSVLVTTIGGATHRLAFIASPKSFYSTLQSVVLNAKNSASDTSRPPRAPSPAQKDDSRFMPKE
ncbi:MAG TPA: PH domain-containing protein [Candidatus Saccharimonadales bacterium]|nr:PH domain-containing protein [Candidatus Saccharimonadales bacterium]